MFLNCPPLFGTKPIDTTHIDIKSIQVLRRHQLFGSQSATDEAIHQFALRSPSVDSCVPNAVGQIGRYVSDSFTLAR